MNCTVILQAEITDFEPCLYAGGGIRMSGNGVFALVTSKYDINTGIDQTESVENVSEDICGP